jgi:hypothetical protein
MGRGAFVGFGAKSLTPRGAAAVVTKSLGLLLTLCAAAPVDVELGSATRWGGHRSNRRWRR